MSVTIPLSNTNARFLSGVLFSKDYKHVRRFNTKEEQTNWFLSRPSIFGNATLPVKYDDPTGKPYFTMKKSYDEAMRINYVMFQNPSYGSKWFYAFVTDLEYVNTSTTKIYLELDVYQTWFLDCEFRQSMVLREHRTQFDSNDKPMLNTLDEGLFYGHEYDTVEATKFQINDGIRWLVIVCKEAIHLTENQIKGSIIGNVPQPLSYYIMPYHPSGAFQFQQLVGENVYPFSTPQDLLEKIYTDETSVDNVVSIYTSEWLGIPFDYTLVDDGLYEIDFTTTSQKIKPTKLTRQGNTTVFYVEEIKSFVPHTISMGSVYANFKPVDESKLMLSPYMLITIDDLQGNRATYRPEYLSNLVLTVRGAIGLSNKVSYSFDDYNFNSPVETYKTHVAQEFGTINNNPNDIPIVNDLLSAYLQGNRNTIANQKDSIIFNGIMGGLSSAVTGVSSAVTGNGLGVAYTGIEAVSTMGNTQLQLNQIQAKQRDIDNQPPTLAKMGSNIYFDFGNNLSGIMLIKKQIKAEFRQRLTDYFKLYGYKTNLLKAPNLNTRERWNYVQTSSCNIVGNINANYLQAIKNIFDNGVTLWHTDDIGLYYLSNEVVT